MKIETLNAHLRLLGPARKGFKWRMVKEGEILEVGDMRCDPSDDNYKNPTGQAGDALIHRIVCDTNPNARYWREVPICWTADPVDITREILPVEDMEREDVEAIIADFIMTVSTEKTFRAFLRKAKKNL